jgi:hypothetical protein
VLSNFYLGDSERQAAAAEADATLMKSKCTPTLLLFTINELIRGPRSCADQGSNIFSGSRQRRGLGSRGGKAQRFSEGWAPLCWQRSGR